MSDANFSLVFEGAAVENGEMDVRDLAPSLLALGAKQVDNIGNPGSERWN